MAQRVLPVGILAAALLADGAGHADGAQWLLLVAVPAAAAAALAAFGALVELPGRCRGENRARLDATLAALALLLVVVAAAARAQAPEAALAASAALAALAVYAVQALAALSAPLPRAEASR